VVSINQLYLIFSNRRIDPYIKAISVKAYTLGLSLAQVREAIRKWF